MSKRKQDDDVAGAAPKKSKGDNTGEPPITATDHDPLAPLLDFSSLETNADITRRFDEIADTLLLKSCLVLNCGDVETVFELLEVEFYLQKSGCHEDPFTHGSEEQKVGGKWYFHRAPRRSADSHRSLTSTTGYRGGTRKGMDLTIGGPASAIVASRYFASTNTQNAPESSLLRGGVLLRSMRKTSSNSVISGPSLLVDEILKLSGATNISDLVEHKWAGDISAFPAPHSSARPIRLRIRSIGAEYRRFQVYRSPRIGLDLSHPGTTASPSHPRVVFLARPYRYFVHPDLLKANGRSQTFIGILRTYLGEGHAMGSDKLLQELVKITGLKENTVVKYLAEYAAGMKVGNLRYFVGSSGKGACASPSTYLKMMGAVHGLVVDVKCVESSSI